MSFGLLPLDVSMYETGLDEMGCPLAMDDPLVLILFVEQLATSSVPPLESRKMVESLAAPLWLSVIPQVLPLSFVSFVDGSGSIVVARREGLRCLIVGVGS